MIPCGSCPGCKLERSRTWGIRCVHEARMHKENCFITLTYNDANLPANGSLVPRHLQLFHKRLNMAVARSRDGVGIRYFGCGEYGSQFKRPHYHSLIFGFDFPDKKIYSYNSREEPIFSSQILDGIWGFGECKIGAVTFDSAAYVARYSLKKASKLQREAGYYVVYDADGVLHERVPEFPVMSRRPGIGATYFDKYGSEIMSHDTIILGNREVPSIRYYDLKIEAIDPERLKVIRRNRRRKALWSERRPDRMRVKELLLLRTQNDKAKRAQ